MMIFVWLVILFLSYGELLLTIFEIYYLYPHFTVLQNDKNDAEFSITINNMSDNDKTSNIRWSIVWAFLSIVSLLGVMSNTKLLEFRSLVLLPIIIGSICAYFKSNITLNDLFKPSNRDLTNKYEEMLSEQIQNKVDNTEDLKTLITIISFSKSKEKEINKFGFINLLISTLLIFVFIVSTL